MYLHFSSSTYWLRSVFPSNANKIEKIEAKKLHLERTYSNIFEVENNGVNASDKREETEKVKKDKIEEVSENEKYLYEEARLQLMENIANLNLGHGKSRKQKANKIICKVIVKDRVLKATRGTLKGTQSL